MSPRYQFVTYLINVWSSGWRFCCCGFWVAACSLNLDSSNSRKINWGQDGEMKTYMDGLVQERCNSIVNALELRLSCTNPLIWTLGGSVYHRYGRCLLVQMARLFHSFSKNLFLKKGKKEADLPRSQPGHKKRIHFPVQAMKYSAQTRPKACLLILCLRASPAHQLWWPWNVRYACRCLP